MSADLNEYLSEKREAIIRRTAASESAQPTVLRASISAEGRSGVRRIRIREHQVISDSPADFAGYDLGRSSPELQLGVLGSCVTHVFLIQAAKLGVPLDALAVEVQGQLDGRAGREVLKTCRSGRTTSATPCASRPRRRRPSWPSCTPQSSAAARS